MTDNDQILDAILGFFRETIHSNIASDTELIQSGLIDSFHVVELIGFIEQTFDLRLEPSDFLPELISTPGAIASFVRTKKAPVPA